MINKIQEKCFRCKKRIDKKIANSIGSVLGNSIKAYWYDRVVNFGDLITPYLLRKYGFTPVHTSINKAQIVSTGSILQDLSEDFSGYIVGSGLIFDITKEFNQATILAVRGSLTRERINAPKSTLLGDPGLLSEKLIYKRQDKQFSIGIIPHYVDKLDKRIEKLYRTYKKEIRIINVQQVPEKVISEIDKCEYILSSSLHGLIVADALNIPNSWIVLSEKVLGNGFKFFDYASSHDTIYFPVFLDGNETLTNLIRTTHSVSPIIPEIKYLLDEIYQGLQNVF